jgi:hypothetical protein
MDVQGAWKFLVSVKSGKIIAVLCVLLVASLFLNVWQYGVIQGQCSSNASLTKTAKLAKAKWQEVELKGKNVWSATDTRIDQLYQEIDNLSRLNDQILNSSQRQPAASRTKDGLVAPAGAR